MLSNCQYDRIVPYFITMRFTKEKTPQKRGVFVEMLEGLFKRLYKCFVSQVGFIDICLADYLKW